MCNSKAGKEMIECINCGCNDQTLTCRDPRTPPMSLEICLCPDCGVTAYEDHIQEIFDDMEDEIGTLTAMRILRDVVR